MSDTLPSFPAPQDDNVDQRKRLAALAESALKFRRYAADALDTLLCEMILRNAGLDGRKFHSPNGRNCMIVLAVGDEAVGQLTDAVWDIQNPPPPAREDAD